MTTRLTTLLTTAALVAGAHAVSAASLEEIKNEGTITIGVKTDYPPFGFRSPDGEIVGIEPDLAQDVADRLGVELELVPVIASNRIEFLEQGRVDALIATMSATEERRQRVLPVEPLYFADSVNILANQQADLGTWEDLDGLPLCATTGAFYNREVAQEYGAEISAYDGSERPLLALQQGQCVGFLYDQTFIQGRLLEEQWSEGYEMPFDGILETPWMMAVAQGNEDLEEVMSEQTIEWMESGRIVNLQEEYGIEPAPYTVRMHEERSGQAGDGGDSEASASGEGDTSDSQDDGLDSSNGSN